MKRFSSLLLSCCLVIMAALTPVAFLDSVASAIDQANEDNDSAQNKQKQVNSNGHKILAKLDANKLAKCQKQQARITTLLKDISTRASNQYTVFEKITSRTQTFVADKKLTVTNYDKIVASINSTHDAAKTASVKVQMLGNSWSCDTDAPKTKLTEFKIAKKAEVAAMKSYKNAVRALIVAVKTAAAQKETR